MLDIWIPHFALTDNLQRGELLTKEGKPANIIDNILKGKMQKFYKDNTLVHQAFIKDSAVSVADYVKSVNGDLKVVGYVRASLT